MTDDSKTLASTSNIAMLVLSLLTDEPMYGYRIIKELDARSHNHFQLKEGSLYPILHQMEKDGLVTTRWRRQSGKPDRRYYYITRRGSKAFAQARGEFEAHVKAMRLVMECGM